MRTSLVRWGVSFFLVVVSIAACRAPVGPQLGDISEHRAIWTSQALKNYSYEYEQTGFFNNLSGHVLRFEVRGDTVRSALFAATGDAVPGSPTAFPTIDALFTEAERALESQTLTAIAFDPHLGYPLRMDIAGPPDAAGSVFAAQLRSIP